jgi:hypothetical protein
LVLQAPERTKPRRGVGAHLSASELSAHMSAIRQRGAVYSEIGKAVVELVERTRQEQGLPRRVEDTSTLNKVADRGVAMKEKRPDWGRSPRQPSGIVYNNYTRYQRHQCNIPHQLVYSVLKAKRGKLFPVHRVDAATGDRHDCEAGR